MSRGPGPRADAAFISTVKDAFAIVGAYNTARHLIEKERREDALKVDAINRRERRERRSLGRWP